MNLAAASPWSRLRCLLAECLLPARCRTCSRWLPLLLEPRQCLRHWLCVHCLDDLQEIGPQCCPRCGQLLLTESPTACGECLRQPPHYDLAIASYRASGSCRSLIHQFKYQGQRELSKLLSKALLGCFDQPRLRVLLCHGHWTLVPVPMSLSRRWRRGYNQSLELARELSRSCGLELRCNALRRKGGGQRQVQLGRRQRAENMAGKIFAAQTDGLQNVILIDDVFTTGATANACARVLKQSGAQKVVVISVARG